MTDKKTGKRKNGQVVEPLPTRAVIIDMSSPEMERQTADLRRRALELHEATVSVFRRRLPQHPRE